MKYRILKLGYFIYYNSDSLKTYYNFLLTCKKKELAIKFLDLIDVDTSKNKNRSFAEPLDAELDELLEKYLGQCSYNSIGSNTFSGFNSFRIPPATSSIKKSSYVILHELFHVLSIFIYNNKLFRLFDTNGHSPYNKTKGKYECFNENITDIFAILALTKLRKKDIYMLDRKNQAKNINEIKSRNTTVLTKRLLRFICNRIFL